ncbi:MAG: hypothetical protein ACI97P_002637, partial [Arcticibacterium sp.]
LEEKNDLPRKTPNTNRARAITIFDNVDFIFCYFKQKALVQKVGFLVFEV